MITCPICHRRPTKRDGRDHRDRQRYACRACHRHFTASSSSIFAGYRWPGEVILAAIRWYLSQPLSARQVTELLAERGMDVSPRMVLTWVQSFAPQLALAARPHNDPRTLLLMAPGWVKTRLGGPNARLTISGSIPNLVKVIDAQHGRGGLQYLDYRGETVAW